MTVTLDNITSRCPDLDAKIVRNHLDRLPADYMDRYEASQVADHLQVIASLSHEQPCKVILQQLENDRLACTVIAFDHAFEFSLIAGMLAGAGFNIDAGDVYTLPARSREDQQPRGGTGRTRMQPASPSRFSRWRREMTPVKRDPHHDAVIIDVFRGKRVELPGDPPFDAWSAGLVKDIQHVIGLLDQRTEEADKQAKQRVNEQVTRRLVAMRVASQPMLFPVDIDIKPIEKHRIRLRVTAQDTPAFLYALTTSLSLKGMSIERIRIKTDLDGQRFSDELDLALPNANVQPDARMLESIKLSALLTKQFTYYLDRSPDPYTALTRFEQLSNDFLKAMSSDAQQAIGLLTSSQVMRDLAKLLGASDYLWEDFIRGQVDSLQPVLMHHGDTQRFAMPAHTLPRRLEEALQGAVGLAQQQDRINHFKDREIFRIDLDHILNPGVDFRDFSENLTFLAENLFATATRLVYDDLVKSYGHPPAPTHGHAHDSKVESENVAGIALPYAVFGLGKLGGVALGYASDIELLFVYDNDPNAQTSGGKRKPIVCREFFELLAREASQFIRTKRAGIFEVDLRLRPYGKEGPLATTADQFARYYDKAGQAHPFEKLAMVRLRWIAGNPRLGYYIESLRNRYVYDEPEDVLAFDRLWEIWTRMKQEKLAGESRVNAKYSPGALVDLEGTIQLLQVMHASSAPQLRVPRMSQVMDSLHRAGVLTAVDYANLRTAYDFLRRLINALRMVRGNALDLFLPPADSLEFTHLARRAGYESNDPQSGADPAEQLVRDFEQHTRHVRNFIREHFGRPCPGETR